MDTEKPKAALRQFVGRNWQRAPFALAAEVASKYLSAYHNNEHDLAVNGESEVVRRMPGPMRLVIDVGMWRGTWTDVVLAHHPGVSVHGFEAAPATATALLRRFASNPDVTIVTSALGDEEGSASLHVDAVDTSINSLLPSPGSSTTDVEVSIIRGDDYVQDHQIDHVDFLKIDVEGFDLRVLRGFEHTLRRGAVTALQFEYNVWNVRARALLADFYDLLEPLGYRIGKIHPDGVTFRAYDVSDENWFGPSCVAVLEEREDIIEALSA